MQVSDKVRIMTTAEFLEATLTASNRGFENGKREAVTPQTITLKDAWSFCSQAYGGEPSAEQWIRYTRDRL